MVEDQSVNADNTAGSGETGINAPDLPTAHLVPPPPPRPSPADFARFTRPSFAQTAFIQAQLPDMGLPVAGEQAEEPVGEVEQDVEQTESRVEQAPVAETGPRYAETSRPLVQAPVYGEPAGYSGAPESTGPERAAVDQATFEDRKSVV